MEGREGTYDTSTLISGVEAPKACLLHRYGPMFSFLFLFSFFFFLGRRKQTARLYFSFSFVFSQRERRYSIAWYHTLVKSARLCVYLGLFLSRAYDTIVGSSERV